METRLLANFLCCFLSSAFSLSSEIKQKTKRRKPVYLRIFFVVSYLPHSLFSSEIKNKKLKDGKPVYL